MIFSISFKCFVCEEAICKMEYRINLTNFLKKTKITFFLDCFMNDDELEALNVGVNEDGSPENGAWAQ